MATQLLDPPAEQREATLEDLLRYDGKAELINGKLVPLMATGKWPNRIAGGIYSSLERFVDDTGTGGTIVVWDLDPVAQIIRSYRRDSPQRPVEFRSGDIASAGEAVPGWQMSVDAMFRGCPDLRPQDLR